MKILEIGPSFSPLARKSDGWQTYSVDHADAATLRRKYNLPEDSDLIEEVDFIWKEGSLGSAIPRSLHGCFDMIIASHVIEHFPDPLGFLVSCSDLLTDQGRVSLVIPDKRYIFDLFRPITTTGDYLYASYMKASRHTKKVVFDNLAYRARLNENPAWSSDSHGDLALRFGPGALKAALAAFEDHDESPAADYVDLHHTVYVPSSFDLIMFELQQLGVIQLEVEHRFPTSGCEFYATLRKAVPEKLSDCEITAKRLDLMCRALLEQSEQASDLPKYRMSGNPCEPRTVTETAPQ